MPVESAQQRSRELIENLSYIEDRDERLMYMIDQGKKAPGLPEEEQIDAFRVEGCQSQLWLVPSFKDGRCYFRADSDALITKGIVTLLVRVYDGSTPEEILELDPDFLAEAGITQHLTPNRRNGLASVCKRIRSFAESCSE